MSNLSKAANNFKKKIIRFYSRIVRVEFEEKISSLISNKDDLDTFFKEIGKYDFNPNKIALTCFPVGKLDKGRKIITEIESRGIVYALEEISLEEKRLMLGVINGTTFREDMKALSSSSLPDKI